LRYGRGEVVVGGEKGDLERGKVVCVVVGIVHGGRTAAVQEVPHRAPARRGEGGTGDLFGVEAVWAELRRILSDWEGTRDEFGLMLIAKALQVDVWVLGACGLLGLGTRPVKASSVEGILDAVGATIHHDSARRHGGCLGSETHLCSSGRDEVEGE
jgi:hypothetical protein